MRAQNGPIWAEGGINMFSQDITGCNTLNASNAIISGDLTGQTIFGNTFRQTVGGVASDLTINSNNISGVNDLTVNNIGHFGSIDVNSTNNNITGVNELSFDSFVCNSSTLSNANVLTLGTLVLSGFNNNINNVNFMDVNFNITVGDTVTSLRCYSENFRQKIGASFGNLTITSDNITGVNDLTVTNTSTFGSVVINSTTDNIDGVDFLTCNTAWCKNLNGNSYSLSVSGGQIWAQGGINMFDQDISACDTLSTKYITLSNDLTGQNVYSNTFRQTVGGSISDLIINSNNISGVNDLTVTNTSTFGSVVINSTNNNMTGVNDLTVTNSINVGSNVVLNSNDVTAQFMGTDHLIVSIQAQVTKFLQLSGNLIIQNDRITNVDYISTDEVVVNDSTAFNEADVQNYSALPSFQNNSIFSVDGKLFFKIDNSTVYEITMTAV
jgi:hypothetical protein